MEDDAHAQFEHLRMASREFAALERRHRELDDELSELAKRRVLTTDEELRRKEIQKQKLATKDRMHEFLRHPPSSEFPG